MAIPTHAFLSISITLLWLTYLLWAIALLHPDISRSWTAVIIFSQCSCFIIKFVVPSMNTSPEIAKQPQTTINIIRMRKPWTDGMRVALGAYYLTYIIPSHNSYSVYFMKCGHNQRFHQVVDSWQVFYVTFEFFHHFQDTENCVFGMIIAGHLLLGRQEKATSYCVLFLLFGTGEHFHDKLFQLCSSLWYCC